MSEERVGSASGGSNAAATSQANKKKETRQNLDKSTSILLKSSIGPTCQKVLVMLGPKMYMPEGFIPRSTGRSKKEPLEPGEDLKPVVINYSKQVPDTVIREWTLAKRTAQYYIVMNAKSVQDPDMHTMPIDIINHAFSR